MIRPRAGNFIYSDTEFEKMKTDILNFKTAGTDGFVFGILTKENEIDIEKCKELVNLAAPFACTLHRAFDTCENKTKAITNAIQCGFTRILSAGGSGTAIENKTELKELIEFSKSKIIIIPCGGIRSAHVNQIIEFTNCTEIHSATIVTNNELASESEIENIITEIN
jgi:copper homeostasis protein